MNQEIDLTILMPCLNEAETLGVCIRKAQQYLGKHQIAGEILIADNGSIDGSREIALLMGARVIPVAIRGYGAALREGIQAAFGKYIIMGDADDSYDFENLDVFVEKLDAGYDLVMGNRFKGGIKPGAMPFLHKYLGNPVLSSIGKLFFQSDVGDFHCGLRGFRREAIVEMKLQTLGMEFASEMVIKAILNSLKITEVPTILSPDGRSRPPHLRTWQDGWRHLRFMLLFSPRWLFLYPGIFLILLGLTMMIWLLPEARQVGKMTLDIHTIMFAAAFILVGFQSFTFAFFTKAYAINEGLLPHDPKIYRLFHYVNLERGLITGSLIALLGAVGSMSAFFIWKEQSFGALDVRHTFRLLIPSVTLSVLGWQIILSSFFLSILGLRSGKVT